MTKLAITGVRLEGMAAVRVKMNDKDIFVWGGPTSASSFEFDTGEVDIVLHAGEKLTIEMLSATDAMEHVQ